MGLVLVYFLISSRYIIHTDEIVWISIETGFRISGNFILPYITFLPVVLRVTSKF